MAFQGFSSETEQFLWGIRLNNSREWFQKHKQDYLQSAYEPLRALGAVVQEGLLARRPELELNLKVSRIYRDVRTVRDGRFYRDYLWFSLFRPYEEGTPRAEYFFSIEPEGCELGLGYYWMPPAMAALYRQRILDDPAPMEELARAVLARPEYQIIGEEYKRPKGQVSELLAPWFNRKAMGVCHRLGYDDPRICGPELAAAVTEEFEWLLPLYQYFQELEQAWQAGRSE